MSMSLPSVATTMNRQRDFPQLELVGPWLEELQARTVFIVADPEGYAASGAEGRLQGLLGQRAVTLFNNVGRPPLESQLVEAVAAFRAVQPDVVLAIGGGAALDLAKAVNHLAAQVVDPSLYLRRKPGGAMPGKPLMAIPTTGGSGAEATHFAVIHADDGMIHFVAHAHMRPQCVMLDSSLLGTLSAAEVAGAGLGALALALESMWDIQANEGTIGYAQEALRLLMGNLENEFYGATTGGRAGLLRAANLAGKSADLIAPAFLIAAAGALSVRTGVPYGRLAGVLLLRLLDYNRQVSTADCADLRGPNTVQMRFVHMAQSLGVSSAEQSVERLIQMLGVLQMPTRLGDLGVQLSHVQEVARLLPQKLYGHNTRRLTPQNLNLLLSGSI